MNPASRAFRSATTSDASSAARRSVLYLSELDSPKTRSCRITRYSGFWLAYFRSSSSSVSRSLIWFGIPVATL